MMARFFGRGETLVFTLSGSPWRGSWEDCADTNYHELGGVRHLGHADAIEELGYKPSSRPDAELYFTEEELSAMQAVGVQPPPI